MLIDRRSFLAGVAATVAAPCAVMAKAPPDLHTARVAAIRFSEMTEAGGHRAIRRFKALSRWHLDPKTYPGNPLIRHEASGLTFRIEDGPDCEVYVRRLFLRTDPTPLPLERLALIGNTARRVAAAQWPGGKGLGVLYLQYGIERPQDFRRWRSHEPNHVQIQLNAPPMVVEI